MEVSLKRPYGGSIPDMVRTKRSKPEEEYVKMSKEDVNFIRRVLERLERQSDTQPAAAQGLDISPGYSSHLGHASEGWQGIRGLQYQSWNIGQSFASPTYDPNPSRAHCDSRTFAGVAPPFLSTSDPTVHDDFGDYNFGGMNNFDLHIPALEAPEPLDVALMNNFDNDSFSRQSSGYPEDRQNTSNCGSDEIDLGRLNRKQSTAQERDVTRNTRDLIACIRCHQQHLKCVVDNGNPHVPCQTCTRIVNQRIYRIPCLRSRIGDTVLFREGNSPSLAWSQRWNNMTIVNLTDWESPDIKFIDVSHGFCTDPIKLEVRRFIPEEGDVLERKWVHEGVHKRKRVEPYAIENMRNAAHEVKRYITANVPLSLANFLEDRDKVVRDTYMLAYKQSMLPRDEESKLLHNVLCLWFAIRHTTASEFICGRETLGMSRERQDKSYPLFGKIPIPPVMSAQLELILTLEVLRPLRRQVLDRLQKMVNANDPKYWFTIYLSCFILLHSCSLATAWQYLYSRRNGVKTRYSMPTYIQELHHGANTLLAHFHYCNKGSYPFSLKNNFPASIAQLDEEQIVFIVRSAEYFEARKEKSRKAKEDGNFHEEMYFVSQLFEEGWQPGPPV